METFLEILKTFTAGAVLGGIFVALKLPIPAPSSISGVMGIVGVFAGFAVVNKFLN